VIFHLPGLLTFIIDFTAWLLIHVFVSLPISRMRPNSFNPDSWLYKERHWENTGKFYDRILKIKKWKGFLPDGAAVQKSGFRKKRLNNNDAVYIRRFILETCRAELTHWVIFVFAIVFFIWNDWWIGLIMIVYAIVVNIPCVFTQRYNRIRLRKVYDAKALLPGNEISNPKGPQ
jgi:glycosyl-4,4'-diaponeurosporenoate acyltransferase